MINKKDKRLFAYITHQKPNSRQICEIEDVVSWGRQRSSDIGTNNWMG
jgi:hypothetical protein